MSRELELVVAADREGGIGAGGGLPWRLPGDMRRFVELTRTAPAGRRNAVIMGRVTWESIPERFRPLAGRLNVVLSRRSDLELPSEVVQVRGLEEALAALPDDIDRIFVIGGGQIYAQALERPDCRRIHLTRVEGSFGCDVFFPSFEEDFERAEVAGTGSDGGVEYRIERWERSAR